MENHHKLILNYLSSRISIDIISKVSQFWIGLNYLHLAQDTKLTLYFS
jgi:hypothetical protein